MTQHPITESDLVTDLRAAGVRSGEVLIVHSSLKSIGPVAGGPATVIAALLTAIGQTGTILMPTFADPQADGLFRVAETTSRTGAITEAFRTTASVLRSHHPTHAVSAWGNRAAEFIAGHESIGGLVAGSPFHNAALAGASVLMIGCDFRSFSLVHVAESIVRVPYLGRVWYPGYDQPLTVVTPDGRELRINPIDPPTCSANFRVVESALAAGGRLRRARIGQAESLLFTAGDALDAAVTLLRADPAALLCDHPRCAVCPTARAILS